MRKRTQRRRPGARAARPRAAASHDVALRVSPEPYRYCTEMEVHGLLTRDPRGYAAFMRRSLASIAAGRVGLSLPPKQVFPDPDTRGDFRVMPCVSRDAGIVTKTVKLIGTNTVQRKVRDQITVGKLLVLDPEENFVSAVMEACLLSSARTGICAALAIDALAKARDRLLVIGSGRVGIYTALYAAAAAGVMQVVLCDRIERRARHAAQWLARAYPRASFEARRMSAVAETDVVAIATTSDVPVVSPPAWGANLVVSLGADVDTQSELDPEWPHYAELYCDTLDSLRFGDLRAWIEAGLVDATAVTDLLQVYRNPRPVPDRPRVFISTGSALFDNLTARYLLENIAA